MSRRQGGIEELALDLTAAGIAFEREYRFHPQRKWRFDIAIPTSKLAVEVDGGTWTGGRHTTGRGHRSDAEKRNAAVLLGWRVLTFSTDMVAEGALATIEAAIASEHEFCHSEFHRCDGGGKGEYDRY